MSSLVIGGSSQIAYYLLRDLLGAGETVVATFRSDQSHVQRNLQLSAEEIDTSRLVGVVTENLSESYLSEIIMTFSINNIFFLQAINLPATSRVLPSAKELMREVHIGGTTEVLRTLSRFPAIKGIFALSSKIYSPLGDFDREVDIYSDPNPSNFYGKTKLESWQLIREYRLRYGLNVSGLVIFNNESKYRLNYNRSDFLIPELAQELFEIKTTGRSTLRIKDFSSRQDWSHSEDVSEAILSVAHESRLKDYLIGSGYGQSVKEILEKSLQLLGDAELSSRISKMIPRQIPFVSCVIPKVTPINLLMGRAFQRDISTVVAEEYKNLLG